MLAYSEKTHEALHSANNLPAPQDSEELSNEQQKGTKRVCQILIDFSRILITTLQNLAVRSCFKPLERCAENMIYHLINQLFGCGSIESEYHNASH